MFGTKKRFFWQMVWLNVRYCIGRGKMPGLATKRRRFELSYKCFAKFAVANFNFSFSWVYFASIFFNFAKAYLCFPIFPLKRFEAWKKEPPFSISYLAKPTKVKNEFKQHKQAFYANNLQNKLNKKQIRCCSKIVWHFQKPGNWTFFNNLILLIKYFLSFLHC